jgi:hypothetical protein
MDLNETGCEVMDWIQLAQNMIELGVPVYTVMDLQVP